MFSDVFCGKGKRGFLEIACKRPRKKEMPPKAATLKAANEIRALISEVLKSADTVARQDAALRTLTLLRAERGVEQIDASALSHDDVLLECGTIFTGCPQGDKDKAMKAIRTLLRGLAPDAVEASMHRQSPSKSPRPQRPAAVAGVKAIVEALDRQQDDDPPPQRQPRRQKCQDCGQPKSGCICVKHPTHTRRHQPESEAPSENDSSSSEEEEFEEDNGEEEVEQEDEEDTSLDIDSPGVFLNPEKWQQLFRVAQAGDIRRHISDFYAQAFSTNSTKNDAQCLLDIMIFQGRMLSEIKSNIVAALAIKAADRAISRLEFLDRRASGDLRGAVVVETDLLQHNLPPKIRKARRRADEAKKKGLASGGQQQQRRKPRPKDSRQKEKKEKKESE